VFTKLRTQGEWKVEIQIAKIGAAPLPEQVRLALLVALISIA